MAQSPAISPGGVVGAGLSVPSQTALSPGAIFSIFGTNFAPAGTSAIAGLVNGALPTTLGHACVYVNGVAAPLFSVFPNQINAQVPTTASGAAAFVTVTAACDTPTPETSLPAYALLAAASPEFFYLQLSATGDDPIAALDASANALAGPGGTALPFATVPANPGDIIVAYATGLGAVSPPVSAGALAPGAAQLTLPYTVSIGGIQLQPADILYAGVAPGFAGLYQLNLRIPSSLAAGAQPVSISVAGVSSPPSALLYIGATGNCTLPQIQTFNALPSQLSAPGATQISWSVSNAASVSTQPSLGTNAATTSLSQTVSATTTYQLSATNSCGSASASLTVGVGTPALAALQDDSGNSISTAYVGDTVRLNLQNSGGLSGLSNVVLTTPDGLPYALPIATDAAGNFTFSIPALPEFGTNGPTAVQVSLLLSNGQQTSAGPSLNVSYPAYAGNAVADFSVFINQFASTYTGAIGNLGPLPNGTTAASLSQTVMSALQPLIDAAQQLATASSFQMPVVPPTSDEPTPSTITVTAQDLGLFMAVLQRVSAGSPASLQVAAEQRPNASTTSCAGIQQQVPLIPKCQRLLQATQLGGNLGKLLSTFGGLTDLSGAVGSLYTGTELSIALSAGVPAATMGSILGIAAALGNVYCYSQPIWLQSMSFQPASIPLVSNTSNPTPSKVDVKANLASQAASTAANLADAALSAIALGLPQALEEYLPVDLPIRAAQIAALPIGYDRGSSALTKLLEEVFPDYQPPTSTSSYIVGYCGSDNSGAGDLINPVEFNAPWFADGSQGAGQPQGMNDFYLFGEQPGQPLITITGNSSHFLIPPDSKCPPASADETFECLAPLAVGSPQGFNVQVTEALDSAGTSCISNQTSSLVTTASPVSQVTTNPGYGTASATVTQINNSTFHIVEAAEEFGSIGRPGIRGCTAVQLSVSVNNPSTPVVLTVNQNSSPTTSFCPDAIDDGQAALASVVPGTYTLPASAGITFGVFEANIKISPGSFGQSCVIDFTLQFGN